MVCFTVQCECLISISCADSECSLISEHILKDDDFLHMWLCLKYLLSVFYYYLYQICARYCFNCNFKSFIKLNGNAVGLFLPTHGRMLFLGLATQVLWDNETFTALRKSNHGDMALTTFNHHDQGWGVNYTRHTVATTQSPEYFHRCVVLEKFNLWTLSN